MIIVSGPWDLQIDVFGPNSLRRLQIEIWVDRQVILQRGKFKLFQQINNFDESVKALNLALILAEFTGQKKIIEKCQADLSLLQEHLLSNPNSFGIVKFKSYIYLEDLNLFLDLQEERAHRFNKKLVQGKILALILSGVIETETLFEKIWGFKYKKELHSSLVRTHLSQLRKTVPNLSEIIKLHK